MAVISIIGAETQQTELEKPGGFNGTVSIVTTFVRTGAAAFRCNPASNGTGYFWTDPAASGNYLGFGLYIASLPSVFRTISGNATGNRLYLETDGKLTYHDGTSSLGQSVALSTGVWYYISWAYGSSITGTLLAIDGTAVVTGTSGATKGNDIVGFAVVQASAVDCYFDDIILDTATLPSPSKVVLLVPISDNANTAWVRGAGVTTTGLFNPVSTKPPPGVVSASETDNTNIESASNTGTANYIANLTTYSTAGIVAADTITAMMLLVQRGEDIATGTKTGSIESTGNPVIAATTFDFFAASGAHGATPTNWGVTQSAVAASPSVTLGSSLTMKVIKTDTTTRVGCVDFMGAYVAYTPAAAAAIPRSCFIRQAVKRAAVY